MKLLRIVSILVLIVGCTSTTKHEQSVLSDSIQNAGSIPFNPQLAPDDLIIHRGILSNDLSEYYFTVSDTTFTNFEILVSKKIGDKWIEPEKAFFNSIYDDHGMSFSPDGNSLVFSSTRPVEGGDVPATWHLWKCEKTKSGWTDPEYIEIPNLKSKLLSHPTLSPDGTLYFHTSNLDYSDMVIYYSAIESGKYQDAKQLDFRGLSSVGYCTPYVSADGKWLIFATIGESLELHISESTGDSTWSNPKKLPHSINQNGQGNPYLSPDSKYLFYARESGSQKSWEISRVSTGGFIR